jgi:outer membrane protein
MYFIPVKSGEKMKIISVLLLLLFFFPSGAQAAETVVKKGELLDLKTCIAIALSAQPDIAAYRYEAEAKASQIRQARKEYFPKLDISGGYTRYQDMTINPKDPYTTIYPARDSYNAAVTLSQNIYDFGKREANIKVKELTWESSLFDLTDKQRETVNTVREAYYDLLKSIREEKVNVEKVGKFEKYAEQAAMFYKAGTRARYDLTKASVDLSGARLELITAQSSVKLAREQLNIAMGITVDFEYEIADSLFFRVYYINFDDALDTAYQKRPDLNSLVSQLAAAEKNLELIKKDYLPRIDAQAGYSAGGSYNPLSQGWNAGVTMSVNLFEGLVTKNKIAEQHAVINKIKAKIAAQKLQIHQDIKKAYLNLDKAEKTISVAQLQVQQATENLELVNLKYTAGISNPLEVTDATVSYSDAQLKHIRALYDYKKAEANIEKAMGKMNEK